MLMMLILHTELEPHEVVGIQAELHKSPDRRRLSIHVPIHLNFSLERLVFENFNVGESVLNPLYSSL